MTTPLEPSPLPPDIASLPIYQRPLVGLGMSSLVLGTVGLLLAIFPVLGVPLSAFGLLFGVLGLIVATSRGGGIRLRWSLYGIAVSALALAANFAIAYAPWGYTFNRPVPPMWQQPPDRPYVPPPE